MSNNRIHAVVSDIVDGIRNALIKHEVTFDEYRAGVMYAVKTGEAGEIPLMLDVFLNSTISDIENAAYGGTEGTIEGPYYLPNAPVIPNGGEIHTYDDDRNVPMLVRGTVKDLQGKPIAGATVDIWHSTPDGYYGGIHNDIPANYYRGKVLTDSEGRYFVRSTVPVPYKIPDQGPTGALLEMMGGHSWRPAHVHFKVRADGYHTLTTQSYFEQGDYVNDDCCNGVRPVQIKPDVLENGEKVIENDFQLAPDVIAARAA
uniref:Chlorocatechol 1,2-dioxygenase n=1 Tax=Sphingomonas sp. TFD44 TaxID=77201 RepID=Q5YB91_9SPHN|nr:TfdC2 [Sphingomonas sp. TFD44]